MKRIAESRRKFKTWVAGTAVLGVVGGIAAFPLGEPAMFWPSIGLIILSGVGHAIHSYRFDEVEVMLRHNRFDKADRILDEPTPSSSIQQGVRVITGPNN